MIQEIQCSGCSLANKKQPTNIVYENDYVTCFLDHEPFNEGHTLILPKKHYVDIEEIDSETAGAIRNACILISKALKQLYNPDGITITQNGGIFNELTHYHLHVVPRYKKQSFAEFYNEEIVCAKDINALSETKHLLEEAIEMVK